jgi:allantoicase
MVADCCTRPQYVLRSYWETGRSRLPGREDVIFAQQRDGEAAKIAVSSRELAGSHNWSSCGQVQKYDIGSRAASELGPKHRDATR